MKLLSLTLIFLISFTGCGQSSSNSGNYSVIKSNFITDRTNNCSSKNCQNLRKEFDLVVYTGKKIYCYWDLKKKASNNDYEKIAKELKNAITDSTSTYEYYLLLQKWSASLQDGHVNAIWGEKGLEELESYKVSIRLELLAPATNHELLIVAKNSPSTSKIPVGAVVKKINGKDAMEVLNKVEKYVSGSTARMRRRSAANVVFSMMDTRDEERSAVKIEYTFKGKTETADLARTITLPYGPVKGGEESVVDYNTLIQAQILPNNIGYLKIDGFFGLEMSDIFTRTMKLLSHTKALILDLRNNGGGNQSGNNILSWLTATPIVRYHANIRASDILLQDRGYVLIDAEYNEGDEFTPFKENTVQPNTTLYKGKVYALTSSYCFSACDTFVSALKENKLATIIGEATGGGTGTPHVFELPYSGLTFRYSVAQGLTAIGKEFIEGAGTLPDIEIFPTHEERLAGEDQQLLKTINVVAEELEVKPLVVKDLKESGIIFDAGKSSYTIEDYDREIKQWTN
jgi:C-terminal processing protease CtpA/Prc